MTTLLLIHHATPVPDPATDPAGWPLSPDGLEAARQLAPLLPADAVLVAGDEPKVLATLAAAAPNRPMATEPWLREVRRPAEPFGDSVREPRLAYVTGRPPSGWEAPGTVAGRIDAAIHRHRDGARPLVLAGHGMAFTTWLTARGLLDDPAAFWGEMRLPDVFVVRGDRVFRAGPADLFAMS